MSKKIFENKKPESVDKQLDTLEAIRQRKEEIMAQETETIKTIRAGFQETVVMFIDMVDSTKFKTTNVETPEKWILRVRQFSEIVGEYITECGGRVVKYIGDELMAVFPRVSKINDSINLLNRIKDLQRDLSEITGEPTTIKIALDFGQVYFLDYKGHKESDPQGTPIDRCARIAKFCRPGTALTSFELVKNSDNSRLWSLIGEAELKGIGTTRIYQFGEGTIEIKETIEIPVSELAVLREKLNKQQSEIETISLQFKEAESINGELAQKLKTLGEKIPEDLIIQADDDDDVCDRNWDNIRSKISTLKKMIYDCPSPQYEYARFLFLHMRDEYWEYNAYAGDTFEASIEANLIRVSNENYYKLDTSNRRNKKAIELMDEIEFELEKFDSECREDDDKDLFDFSLKSPEFWNKYVGINVTK
jgi:class 3 adenylate cyclase